MLIYYRDYELTLPHQSQQLNENELIEYIENSISIDWKKGKEYYISYIDGEVYFYFKDHNTSWSTKRDTKEPEIEQVNTNKESPCLGVAEEREKSLPEYKWDEKHDEIKPRLGDNLNPDIKNLENEELKKIKEIKEEILFIEESKEKGDNMKVNISEECEDKLKTLDEISKLEMDKLDEDISSSKSNSPKEESKITHHSYKTWRIELKNSSGEISKLKCYNLIKVHLKLSLLIQQRGFGINRKRSLMENDSELDLSGTPIQLLWTISFLIHPLDGGHTCNFNFKFYRYIIISNTWKVSDYSRISWSGQRNNKNIDWSLFDIKF